MTTTPNWLDKRAYLTPHQEAIVLPDDTTYTFLDLQNDAKRLAKHFSNQGFQKGDHIALLSDNCYEFAVAVHALSYIGAVGCLLNTRLTKSELAFQLEDANVQGLIFQSKYENTALKLKEELEVLTVPLQIPHVEWLESDSELKLDNVSHILYTSGTTGNPKGVQLTYGNHYWNATASVLNLGLHSNDRWLLSLPMFHVGGLSILFKSVIYGMPVHLHERFDVDTIHHDIMNKGVTVMSVVALMVEELMKRLGDGQYPDTFRCFLLGGGPASQSLLEHCRDKNVPVFQSYGMTETASQFCTLDEDSMLSKIGSSGKALFPGQLKIVEEGQECSANEIGEIYVKGPTITPGYWNRTDANEDTFDHDWLKTGDLGYLDEDGYLFVVDRRKDLIISGGENVYPAQIESVLKGMNGIQDVGVVGVDDDKWGQVPAAFVVLNDAVSKGDIQAFAEANLAKYKVPKAYYFVDELPRNASKKIQRHKLLELLREENDA
ncbi:o-succinylbenzoate--CoA ligase [Aquisalibacillus elongatus]|uniref:2-succinylbenzoate--CoA ligase n=1 Tax=Aquisalibacillus elongatus TaxID=485577 RepID=A0A3N5B3Z7_9BACI|nr:o-succinylbenzoate--CoA ligase [Aquisalibacillus elongatus]RPF50280.1 2-succinylbenzoyl-CoA synthetase [Aquisalibacillus elongatus]